MNHFNQVRLFLGLLKERLNPYAAELAAVKAELLLTKQQKEALENKVGALYKKSMTDPLTGIPNREGFETKFRKISNKVFIGNGGQGQRSSDPSKDEPTLHPKMIAVFILDLDHFKFVNDTYGHDVGDEALRKVAAQLQSHFQRADDAFGRLGGEEFGAAVILDRDSGVHEALERAELLRKDIATHCNVAEGTHQITPSIGVAFVLPDGRDMDSSVGIKKADKAMYEAKKRGRNRTYFYDSGSKNCIASNMNPEPPPPDAVSQTKPSDNPNPT